MQYSELDTILTDAVEAYDLDNPGFKRWIGTNIPCQDILIDMIKHFVEVWDFRRAKEIHKAAEYLAGETGLAVVQALNYTLEKGFKRHLGELIHTLKEDMMYNLGWTPVTETRIAMFNNTFHAVSNERLEGIISGIRHKTGIFNHDSIPDIEEPYATLMEQSMEKYMEYFPEIFKSSEEVFHFTYFELMDLTDFLVEVCEYESAKKMVDSLRYLSENEGGKVEITDQLRDQLLERKYMGWVIAGIANAYHSGVPNAVKHITADALEFNRLFNVLDEGKLLDIFIELKGKYADKNA